MKKVKILGKMIPVFVLVLLGIGMVSAALLNYFGTITTTANVEQAVTLVGNTNHIIPELAPSGEVFCYLQKIKNDASVNIPIGFETLYDPDGIGITTTYYSVPETTTLHLESKDTNWDVDGRMTADLTFTTSSPTFDWELEATGLHPSTEYVLIYYADKQDRFVNWGGDNPGALIATVTADGSGVVSASGSVDLNMNLPHPDDWNGCSEALLEYGDKGAKIWLVPKTGYDEGTKKLVGWNPTTYLFEEELITYFDCDLTPDEFVFDVIKGAVSVTTLETKSKALTPMLICYDFDVAIAPETYTIITNITPV